MKHNALWLTGGALLLATIAALLIACGSAPTPRPTLSWLPMPTRAPSPTPLPLAQILAKMEPALLSGQPESARIIWEEAAVRAPEDSRVQREGARLALALGNPQKAETRAWTAIQADPSDAITWTLLGISQQRQGKSKLAQQSFAQAQTLAPELAPELFAARWLAAQRAADAEELTALAQSQLMRQPQDPLLPYYRAEALLSSNYAHAALDLLLINVQGDSSALLWYTLGRAYLQVKAGTKARISLEVAQVAYTRGDNSILLASDDPRYPLNAALGRAYLLSGDCEQVRPLLLLLSTPYPALQPLIAEAARCPTPTPTCTPWLPADWAVSP
ncbi:MAG TPA: hypothetical protein G4N98_03390 [Thermoflexia bacterium]|nr:hypothetical protein [Thermoflexia bacterium]